MQDKQDVTSSLRYTTKPVGCQTGVFDTKEGVYIAYCITPEQATFITKACNAYKEEQLKIDDLTGVWLC